MLPDSNGKYAQPADDPVSSRNYFLIFLKPITDEEYETVSDIAYLRTLPFLDAQQQLPEK
jgi:hypothetical protein